eukprot:CAMPEP_0172440212 /NCGR_PEP_ID=MMETSP1065-20121228/921_1 /TAXON_ID=265537 /ORGANISM="Amphiprora paludosa, Strain CCMP125" /LENGTH=871 /DNA_ID=CAMNT_0013188997 /DNA_START=52 /DNA_END=2667 /DNA_ORIENTATION=-
MEPAKFLSLLLVSVSFSSIHGFSLNSPLLRRPAFFVSTKEASVPSSSSTSLFAKKKKASPASAALEALEALDALDADEPLSKKEQKELEKKKKKEAAAAAAAAEPKKGNAKDDLLAKALANEEAMEDDAPQKKMSKKEEMLAKALALEAMDEAQEESPYKEEKPKLSKKELKALEKKEQKQREKEEKKRKKREQNQQVLAEDDGGDTEPAEETPTEDPEPVVAEEVATPVQEVEKPTLEDKIRKERPPPRIRVMESTQPGYTSLRMEGIGITFRNQEVLKDVTWGVQTGDRIGLVGQNGAGKTTQLRILAGELEPTTGDVVKSSKSLRVAMLRQEFVDELILTRTLREEMLSVFDEENKILQDLKDAEEELASLGDEADPERMQQILDRMQELQNEAENKEVYVLESRVQKVMDLMGFTDDEAEDLVASFSGGWKMRIGLGKVLLKDPNILLLDEPTNHLDLDSVEWLEAFLREQSIPMIIVSHDREFLDQVCTKIVDAEGGACTEYEGNYSRFLQLKKSRMDAWNAAYNAQEKKMKEERQWIQKFRVKQPQAVKQRQAKLEKMMKSEDYVKKPPFLGKPFRFRFPDAPRLSPEVGEVTGMSHSYRSETTQNRLFDDVELFVEKGDRIAVVGPNGAGKSTLLRLLTGKEAPDEGSAELVGQNVVMNYFEQNQADVLDLDKTVLETIQGASSGQSYNELRALLGQFLFKGDDVEKKIEFLSGGEKARLSLCCMMLRPANLLILDEPTNHLDISSCEMLEEALQHFAGSVMVVSHDRYFISKVATSIVAIEDKKLVKYQGDYKFYMEKSEHMRAKVEARYVNGVEKIRSAPIIDLEEIAEGGKKKKNFGGAKNAGMVTRKDKGVKNAKRMQAK